MNKLFVIVCILIVASCATRQPQSQYTDKSQINSAPKQENLSNAEYAVCDQKAITHVFKQVTEYIECQSKVMDKYEDPMFRDIINTWHIQRLIWAKQVDAGKMPLDDFMLKDAEYKTKVIQEIQKRIATIFSPSQGTQNTPPQYANGNISNDYNQQLQNMQDQQNWQYMQQQQQEIMQQQQQIQQWSIQQGQIGLR